MAKTNVEILNLMRATSPKMIEKIGEVTVNNLIDTVDIILNDSELKNEFYQSLGNKILKQKIINRSYMHNLKMFKRDNVKNGVGVQNLLFDLLQAKQYDSTNNENKHPFSREKQNIIQSFDLKNREVVYKITVSDVKLREIMTNEGGLSSFINAQVSQLNNSDENDEFITLLTLFNLADKKGWIKKTIIPTLDNEANVKRALVEMQTLSSEFIHYSTDFNGFNFNTFTPKEEQVLMIESRTLANINVESLATAYNLDKAELKTMLVEVPNIPIDGVVAILMDKHFINSYDTEIKLTNLINPENLYTNYWKHHHSINGVLPYLNCVAFSTLGSTLTGLTITPDNTSVAKNDFTIFTVETLGTNNPPLNVEFSVVGANSSNTYVTQQGTLFVGFDETATTLTVNVKDKNDNLIEANAVVTVI